MVKKLQKMAAKNKANSSKAFGGALPAGLLDNPMAQAVKDSAQQIWAAGLGAFAKAQGEGGKVFEALVKEGLSLQKKTQGIAEEKISEVTGKMSAMAGTVTAKAGQNWDKLEAIFEQRTAKALNKLGVPTAKDVDALVQRVDKLAAAVAKLNKAAPAKKAAANPEVKAEPKAEPKAPVKRARKTAKATTPAA